MGFYDFICECGCVSVTSSLDNFQSSDYWVICDEHKLEVGKEFLYDLTDFRRRHGCITNQNFKNVKILDIQYNKSRRLTYVKMKVQQFDTSNLKSSKKIYFSEFDDEPSFEQHSENAIIIDIFDSNFISGRKKMNPEKIQKEAIYFDWEEKKLIFQNK